MSARERLAVDQLHDDEVPALVLLDGVNGADAWMVERGGGASLALEALEHPWLALELAGQELERHSPPQVGVFREIDGPHPARADRLEDLVVTDGLADHSRSAPLDLPWLREAGFWTQPKSPG